MQYVACGLHIWLHKLITKQNQVLNIPNARPIAWLAADLSLSKPDYSNTFCLTLGYAHTYTHVTLQIVIGTVMYTIAIHSHVHDLYVAVKRQQYINVTYHLVDSLWVKLITSQYIALQTLHTQFDKAFVLYCTQHTIWHSCIQEWVVTYYCKL